jgi:TolA-binding protein
VTQATLRKAATFRHAPLTRAGACLAACACLLASGCVGNPFSFLRPAQKDSVEADSGDGVVLRGGGAEHDGRPTVGPAADIESGKQLFARNQYSAAERIFSRVADNQKAPPHLAEEARYYQGECLRMQAYYPSAADTYCRQLKDFPSGMYQQQALKRIFDIANYWLDDTRDAMEAHVAQESGQRWLTWPVRAVSFERSKPILDVEGRAVQAMETVYLNDPTGPLGELALFYIGSVKFFRADYKDADFHFNQIVKHHPNGKLAAKALEMSIVCKQRSVAGPDYDGRKIAEARELIHTALQAYPEVAAKRSEFLEEQLKTIHERQAAKDYGIAEFYRRTGHPGSAYFCYELVRRRYPGTTYAKQAEERMNRIRDRAERAPAPQPPAAGTPTPAGEAQPARLPALLPAGTPPGQDR